MIHDPNYTPPQDESQEEIEIPGFTLYRELAYMFALMSKDDAGSVIKAAFDYFMRGDLPNPPFSGVAKDAFNKIRKDIDRNAEKYRKTVERNRKNGRKRWNKE